MTFSPHILTVASYAALVLGLIGTALLAYALDHFVDTTIMACRHAGYFDSIYGDTW